MATQQPFNTDPTTAAILGPDVLEQQYKMQLQQMMAQRLMEQGQTDVPQGQMISGHYVAPSVFQHMAKLGSTLSGQYMLSQLPKQQAALGKAQMDAMGQAYGIPSTPAQQPDATPQTGQAQSMPVADQMPVQGMPLSQPGQPTQQSMPGVPQGQPAAPKPMFAPFVGQDARQSMLTALQLGPLEAAKLRAGQADNRTDAYKNAVNAGLQPGTPEFQAAQQQALNKSTYVAPTRLGEGYYNDPTKGVQALPNPDKAFAVVRDPSSATGWRTVNQPGGAEAVSGQAAAIQAGKNQQETQLVNGVNGPVLMRSSDVINQAGGGANSPPPPQVGGVPSNLSPRVQATMSTESGGNPNAVSPKGASGTMQTMPGTLSDPGLGVRPAADNSPAEKQRTGIDYLAALDDRYGGNKVLGSIAYNMGFGATDTWLKKGGDYSKLPAETRNYIASVLTKEAVMTHGQTGARALPTSYGLNQANPQQASQQAQMPVAPPMPQQQKLPGIPLQTAQDKTYQESLGPKLAANEETMNTQADSALSKIAQNNKMIGLIPQIMTGALADKVTQLKTLTRSLGVDIGDPAPNQEFAKYAIKGALESAKQIYGGRVTNLDVMTQVQSNPGANIEEKAIYQLIKYDNVIQQRSLDKQNYYYNEYQGPKAQFEMAFNRKYPLMGGTAPQPGQSASQSAPATPIPASAPPATVSPALLKNADGSFTYKRK